MNVPRFSVTILADNKVPESPSDRSGRSAQSCPRSETGGASFPAGILAEHGFSALLQLPPATGTQAGASGFPTVLFDTGRGALIPNAAALGLSLASVTDIVLSHGHYDHTDALPKVLALSPSALVHASERIFTPHWSAKTGTIRPIGLSEENCALLAGQTCPGAAAEVLGAPAPTVGFRQFLGSARVPGTPFHLIEGIPRSHPLETPSPLLFADAAGTVPDPVPEELALWAETPQGLVILTGCCHSGLINTCERARAVSGCQRIRAVIGGFHLAGAGEERLEATARYILETGMERIACCHCTGNAETEWLKARLGETVQTGFCGLTLHF